MQKQIVTKKRLLDDIFYFHNTVLNNRLYFENNKGVYYMFFDKLNQTYLLECPTEHINTDNKKIEYNKFFLYTTPNQTTNKNEGMIGYLSFELDNNTATLLRLQITNKNYLRRGIGSNLLAFFEYFARSNNYNYAIGIIAETNQKQELEPLNKEFIKLDDLKLFYQKQGYTVFYEEKEQKLKFKKDLSHINTKEIDDKLIKVTYKNANYQFLSPNAKKTLPIEDNTLDC